MAREKSLHDAERDRIAADWSELTPFNCAGCTEERTFPRAVRIGTEVHYEGRLRVDVAAIATSGKVTGVVEVVHSHPPSDQALAAQESLGFAYYRIIPLQEGNETAVWLCSPECWVWYRDLPGGETSTPWEARRCDECDSYFYQNRLSWFEFRDWADDPHSAYCIHCAAAYDGGQCRAPANSPGPTRSRRFASRAAE